MSHPVRRAWLTSLICATFAAMVLIAAPAAAQVPPPNPNGPKANWALYDKFSTQAMRGMTYSTNIAPRWIGETDSLFYYWDDHTGKRFFLVNAFLHTKKPLFDQVKLAAQLSVLAKHPYDPLALPFTTLNITKDHKNFRFEVDSMRYNWAIATETLTSMGRYRAGIDTLMVKDEEVEIGGGGGRGAGRGGAPPVAGRGGGAPPDFRNFSPDSTAFVFGRNHNLYLYEKGTNDTIKITSEGIENYSFTTGGGRGGGGQDTTQQDVQQNGRGAAADSNRNVRVSATWSGDSKAFYITRTDIRAQKELYLVRSLTEPRPTLMHYPYAMPGEDSVPRPEYWTYTRGEKAAKKAPIAKWKDQQYFSPSFVAKDGSKLRLERRDRLQRNIEYIELDVPTGNAKVLWTDTKGDFGSLETSPPIYVHTFNPAGGGRGGGGGGGGGAGAGNGADRGDFIMWSEKSGWGHLYLYANDGTLKRQLTSGDWRADPAPVAIDTAKGFVYVRGQGREPGENLYQQHLYKVGLADGSITLLDPGNLNHTSSLSSNKKWVVDQGSRIDTVPRSSLRDALTGKPVMDLETADLSRLYEAGWKFPTAFQTLAADGITPIFGNMWKPFDFDSTKKYPIIANVYPGPQTESVTLGFTAGGGPQQLAQLGFIVIQIGNRGGNPARSAAYQDFSYYNMRDYALADKKTGIEQLASRYKFIDLDRVGIFGHSGGGFLTAAALLLPPYNEFFKVGVSESGNHDNNIYNSNWSEQYHGLRWVAAADTACMTAYARSKGRSADFVAGANIARDEYSTGRGGRGAGNAAGAGAGGPEDPIIQACSGRGNTVASAGRGAGGRGGRGGGGGGGRGGRGNGGGAAAPPAAAPAGDGQAAPAAPPDSVFWIYVPTNIDIASNLKGKLMLETGDEDNNVSPSNTIRLINALIQNNKRFDFMIYPGQPHAYGPMAPYAFQLQAEYFAEFLLGDTSFRRSADFTKHSDR